MNQVRLLIAIGVAVALSAGVLLYGNAPGWFIVIAGFLFVIGGTLVATLISEGINRTEEVIRKVPRVFSASYRGKEFDVSAFLGVSEAYRKGLVRHAELGAKRISDPFLRQGAQLIIDGVAMD